MSFGGSSVMANETGFASLGPNERGLVVAPKFDVKPIFDPLRMGYPAAQRQHHIIAKSLQIPRKSLIYGLTFCEKLVLPVVVLPAIGLQISRFTEFEIELIKAHKLECPTFPIYNADVEILEFGENSTFRSSGGQNEQILSAYLNVYYSLSEQCKGRWTLSSESHSLIDYISEEKRSGTIFRLINAIPIITDVDDVEKFLRWLEKTKTERRRFTQMIVGIADEIDYAGGAEPMINDKINEINEICKELIQVTSESGLPYKSTRIELDYNFDLGKFVNYGKIASFTASMFSGSISPFAFFAGGLASKISIEPGRALKRARFKNSPFASILKLQYSEVP